MKKFFTMLLAFTFIVTAVIVIPTGKRQKANALCMDEGCYYPGTNIYYFSDSPVTSAYQEFFEDFRCSIIYDTHPYITIQELQYMFYSGYFWGFTPPCMVVLELKAMKPPITLLTNLIKCFRMQNCGVILITPYMSDFGTMWSTYGEDDSFDYVSGVTYDKFALYLQDSVLYMLNNNGQMKDKSTIFMDGRIVGLEGVTEDYDVLSGNIDIWMYQKAFTRLLHYMYYGVTFEIEDDIISDVYFDEANFMKPLYMDLWDEYMESVYSYNDSSLELDYFNSEQTDVALYRNIWNARLNAGRGSYHWNYMRDYIYDYNDSLDTSHYEDYYSLYQDFYQGIINNLFNRNIHIIAHLGGTKYIDLLSWEVLDSNLNTPYTYTFDSCASFGNLYQDYSYLDNYTYSLDYVYGMGIWYFKTQFYNYLKDVQDHWDVVKPQYNILNDFPIFIYEEDPITWSDSGLTIISNSPMREYWSDFGDYGDVNDNDIVNWDDFASAIINYFSRF